MEQNDTYDKTKVGKLIGRGGDSSVYLYKNDQVIKFSSFSFIAGIRINQKQIKDYRICKKYFGQYVVNTTVVRDFNNRQHIEIQPKISGRPLDLRDSSDHFLINQLREISATIDKMTRDGHATIDLVGLGGMFRLRLGNIFIDQERKLKIIDAALMDTGSTGIIGSLLTPFVYLMKIRQKYILKRFLQIRDQYST